MAAKMAMITTATMIVDFITYLIVSIKFVMIS